MPKTHTITTFTLDELDDNARRTAIETLRDKLAGEWGDACDIDAINEAITYTLAAEIKYPGWDTYGSGDFPGIDGIKLDEWDVSGCGRAYARFTGYLTPESAPGLPWSAGMDSFTLGEPYEDYSIDWDLDPDTDADVDASPERERALIDAWESALGEATAAGVREYEYRTSEDFAVEIAEANEIEFLVDGSLYLYH